MTSRTYDHLSSLARTHLPEADAARWLGLLRPGVQLRQAREGDDVVARLGGTPTLPDQVPWPEWPGHGPLRLIAEVDLAVLARTGLDAGIELPADGRLLAFYFHDPADPDALVLTDDPDSSPGARLLHVAHTVPTTDPIVELAGVQVLTWPGYEHPELEQHGLDELPDLFIDALNGLLEDEVGDVWGHHLGGWATPVQGPVEYEAVETRLGEANHDDTHDAEALRWRPVLQIDNGAAGWIWGDANCLYWLARTDGTASALDSDIAFTWQG